MTTAKDLIHAHELVDKLANGYPANEEELDHLRNCLPERPERPTVNDLLTRVHDAWINANPHEWGFKTPKEHDDWLFELRDDLIYILEEQASPAKPAHPALPAGMRLAEHEEYGRVVVSPRANDIGQYKIFHLDDSYLSGADVSYAEADALTFIDAEPAHPEFLETEADYQSAPDGTIVACDDTPPCHKFGSEWSSVDFWGMKDDRGMSRAHRRVLRWGK